MSFFTPSPPNPNPAEPSTFRPRAINLFTWITGTMLGEMDTLNTNVKATAAALTLNSVTDTSASSVLIGTGPASFIVSASKSYAAGMWLSIADTAAPAVNSMVAQVTSYSGTALAVNVPANGIRGSGTKTAWVITLTAAPSTDVAATFLPVSRAASLAASRTALEVSSTTEMNAAINGLTKRLLQNLTFQTGVLASGTTVIPLDNTIPQITEGDQYLTLTITPTSASNILEIDVTAVGSVSLAQTVILALFQDAVASALASEYLYTSSGGAPFIFSLKHVMLAGSTAAITFRVRIGPTTASTFYLNGDGGLARFGGTLACRITIKEYAA